jgi:tellurite resistance protein
MPSSTAATPAARAVVPVAPSPPLPAVAPARPAPRAAGPGALARWVPAEERIAVAGRELPGGMLYVGTELKCVAGGGVEPALINPKLRAGSPPRHDGQGMSYWPSYSEIPTECRAAYLDWLAGGRQAPGAYIGYVFLFFYGLERRALLDLRQGQGDPREFEAITREVQRLLEIHGGNASFRRYGTAFIEALVALRAARGDVGDIEALMAGSAALPVRYAVSRFAREQKPLPPQLALAWVMEEGELSPRTPATRCPREFRQLFAHRYHKVHGAGLIVSPTKSTLRLAYKPASASFLGEIQLPTANLPKPSSQPLRSLRALVEECTEALEPYSRWLGRRAEGEAGLAAVALLPPELAADHPSEDVRTLRRTLEQQLEKQGGESALLDGAELLCYLPGGASDKPTKSAAVLLLQAIERVGFAIEPDPRFGGPAPASGEQIVIFRPGPDAPMAPSASYAAATALLHLAAVVAFADGSASDSEQQRLEGHLESSLELAPGERTRLRAHLRWLLTTRPGLTGMKKRLAALEPAVRQTLGRFAISVAGADGHVSAEEMKTLGRIYTLLGLDSDELYSHVHAAGTPGGPPPATGPVTVQPASPAARGFALPSAPQTQQTAPEKSSTALTLDMAAVQARLAETAAVSSLLGSIFTEDEPPTPAQPVVDSKAIAGLDMAHSALLQALAERPAWSRAEFEQLSAKLGLMPDGAFDSLNEAALEKCGEIVLEGEDPIELNKQTFQEMLA